MKQVCMPGNGGGTTYSTTETLTGDTWIDGKPIYRRVLILNNVLDQSSYDASSWAIDSLVKVQGIVERSDGYVVDASYCYPNGYSFVWAYMIASSEFNFYIGILTAAQLRLIVEYTKN